MFDTCQLLASLRVLDIGGAESDGVGRLLADLGADVLKIEPSDGSAARRALPAVDGVSVPFALNNANKRCAVLDGTTESDRARLIELAEGADIVIDGGRPGGAGAFGTSCAELADRFDHLVTLQMTDFGTAGPYASWQATDAVLYAMSTALSRSGPATGRPVLPPQGIASATAVVQATWAVLAAYQNRLRHGRGEYIDFSRYEAILQTLDPPFGSEGQAAVGQKASRWRGRPRNQQIYPTLPCRDGHVRLCLLSARQWRGMRAWLGEPEEFSDPKFESIVNRYAASRELNALIAATFADQTMDDLVAEGQARGVPIAAVLSPADALRSEHFREVGALTTTELTSTEPAGSPVSVPTGPFVVDGEHAGLRWPAPRVASDSAQWSSAERDAPGADVASPADSGRPFDGLRILDLGVIVAGGELGRLFADLGADVIKVESAAYPDGLRQTLPGHPMSRSWALTHRNERSLGLDLRHPDGAALFRRLIATSDALFANFKPGTLASLGFSHDELRALNPRIVLAESSAFGESGPWSARMGYGPLVRATTGVSGLWTDQHAGDANSRASGFFDATTVFPDHVAAKITAIAALAALIARDSTPYAARVHISQAEVAVNQLAAAYVTDDALGRGLPVQADDALHAVLACAGEDEWCAVSVTSGAQRSALATVLGLAEPPADGVAWHDAMSEWTATRDKSDVARVLQEAGVPAGPMFRASDVLADPQVVSRGMYTEMVHPLFDEPMPSETHPAPYRRIPEAELRPAPLPGEQTRQICREALGLADDEIESLIAADVLFSSVASPSEEDRTASRATRT